MKSWTYKLIAIIPIAFFLGIGYFVFNSAGCKREIKSFKSDHDGGLNRTVTVYDYNGKVIKSWNGKFDVSESTLEVWFDDENGKRVIIHGGIVINQEN